MHSRTHRVYGSDMLNPTPLIFLSSCSRDFWSNRYSLQRYSVLFSFVAIGQASLCCPNITLNNKKLDFCGLSSTCRTRVNGPC